MRNNQPRGAGRNAQPNPHAKQFELDLKPRGEKTKWLSYYLDYMLKRPTFLLICIGLGLEVQPIETLRPSTYIVARIINIEEDKFVGLEDEKAVSEAKTTKENTLIQIAGQCQSQRDQNAAAQKQQCVTSGGSSGYCRSLYESYRSTKCPEMPNYAEGQ